MIAALCQIALGDETLLPWRPSLPTQRGPLKSGGAIDEEIKGSIDVLFTDMPLTDSELDRARQVRGSRLLHFATGVTAVVPSYNVAGLQEPLRFSSEILAAIFLGTITQWNDPAIVAMNPGAPLPAEQIRVIGHAKADGSTYTWTDFLAKTNADWRQLVGRVRSLARFPAFARGETESDLAKLVKQTPNSITYTEFWASEKFDIPIGRVRNKSGHDIEPSADSIAAAALTASPTIQDDFRESITDASGPGDYPIASFTWIVIPDKFSDSEKRSAVTSLMKWILTQGQDSAHGAGMARLPADIAKREIQIIESVR